MGMVEHVGRVKRSGVCRVRWLRKFLVGLPLVLLLLGPMSAAAEAPYEADNAGNPLRMLAYVVHPVGVVFDYLVLRPAYWVGSHEPFRSVFGRTD